MKYLALILLVGVLGACKASDDKPESAVYNYISALNNRDSAALFNSFSSGVRERWANDPRFVHFLMDTTKGTHLTATVYSTKEEGTVANVVYSVRAEGRVNAIFDSVTGQVYKEGGNWKYGWLLPQPQLRIRPVAVGK